MSKKYRKFLKKMKKRIKNPKFGHFHIRKSLMISLLTSCAVLLVSTVTSSYANDDTNFILKNHFKKSSTVIWNTEQMMNDTLSEIKSIQELEAKYIEILEVKLSKELSELSKGDIAEKLKIVTNKLKAFSYDDVIKNNEQREEFAQLSALKYLLYSMYDHTHYSKNIDLNSLFNN